MIIAKTILILEDDLKTLSKILSRLATLEEDQKMASEKALLEQMLEILTDVKLPEDIVALAKIQVKRMEEQRVSGVTNERRHLRDKMACAV